MAASGASAPLLADLTLYHLTGQLSGSAQVRSFWQGQTELQGRACEIGWVPVLSGRPSRQEGGQVIRRSWDERSRPFNLQDGPLDGVALSGELFFENQGYGVEASFTNRNGQSVGRLVLTERPTPPGELRLSGQFVHRLAWEGSKQSVVLD